MKHKMKRQNAKCPLMLAAMLTMVVLLITGCSSHPHFKNSEEALKGCGKILKTLSKKKECNVKDLSSYTREWLETQDSAYAAFARDSALSIHSPIALTYFALSDSIRNEITRLAFSQPRTLRDVMYLRLYSSKERDKVTSSDTFKDYVKLFKQFDKNNLIPTMQMTVGQYYQLLKSTKRLKNEDEIITFMRKEDFCFRSLMSFLSAVPQEQLDALTKHTNILFDNLYSVVGKHNDAMNDNIMLLLTMRFDRRIIQNCQSCINDINGNKNLDKMQRANYRWMLIQPFMTLDSYSSAALTKEQQKVLLNIAEQLPQLLSKLDANDGKESPESLSKVLSDYFLKSFVTNL